MGTCVMCKLHRSVAIAGDCDSAELDVEVCDFCHANSSYLFHEILTNSLSIQDCPDTNYSSVSCFPQGDFIDSQLLAVTTEPIMRTVPLLGDRCNSDFYWLQI